MIGRSFIFNVLTLPIFKHSEITSEFKQSEVAEITHGFRQPLSFTKNQLSSDFILGNFLLHPLAMQPQQAEIIEGIIAELFKLGAQLEHKFIGQSQSQLRQIRILKLVNIKRVILRVFLPKGSAIESSFLAFCYTKDVDG